MPHRLPLTLSASLLLLSIAGCHTRQAAPPAENALSQALHSDVDAGRLTALHWPDFSDYKPLVESFYAGRGWTPAWVKGHEATTQARALSQLFARSAEKGLHPDDYDAALWPARFGALAGANDQALAAFDTAMTVAAMRYISDLHIGRVNPEHFSFGVDVAKKKYDLPGFLSQQVVQAGDVSAALGGVEPDSPAYRATLEALAHYRQLAQQAGNEQVLPAPSRPLTPGSAYASAAALAARLALLGDLSAGDPTGTMYSAAISDGVKHFQVRHGLTPDGQLTPKTVTALNVPLATRVLQLEDTLERMRWLAPEYENAPIEVNIPEFLLRAYDEEHKEQFEMRVVVGQSMDEDHKTPVLVQEMKYLVLRPYWNVTPTIVKQEIVPKVEADKGYIEAKNFEVTDRAGKPVEHWTPDGLAHGEYMVREKPGPANSLGLVKFMFPNKLNIYLHSTPATELFKRTRRDFSHGCIRLQDPEKLADWVLRDQPEWTPEAIHNAMETGEDNKTVSLKKPIPVVIFYATARVAEDGTVHFFDDIYGYDKEMEAVLAQGDPFPVKPKPKPAPSDTA